MSKLASILVGEVLEAHVRDNATVRLCIKGIPAGLAQEIIADPALQENGLLDTGVYLYSNVAGDNLGLDRLAGQLGMEGITRRRNLGLAYVLLFPDDATSIPPPSIEDTATPIESVLDDLELIYFKALGIQAGEVPDWYHDYLSVLDASGSSSRLDQLRWGVLEMMDTLSEIEHWPGHLAIAAALGLPASGSAGDLPKWSKDKKDNPLDKLSIFMGTRSIQEALDELAQVVNQSGRFADPGLVIKALRDFFSWCTRTTSVQVASDWERPHRVFRYRPGHPELVEAELGWRTILDRECWELLLHGLGTENEYTVRVYADGKEKEAGRSGGAGIYIVPGRFELELRNGDRPVEASWEIKAKRRQPCTAGGGLIDVEELTKSGAGNIFKSVFEAYPTEPRENAPKVQLACMEVHAIGMLLFLDEGELDGKVSQPAEDNTNGGQEEFVSNIRLKAPGFVRLRIAYDPARWSPLDCSVDDEPRDLEGDGNGEVCVRFETDGAEQTIAFRLRDTASGREAQLTVNLQIVGEEPGSYASVLHILSECHAQRKKVPAKVDTKGAGKREPLIVNSLKSHSGHPVVLRIGDEPSEACPVQGKPFIAVPGIGHDLGAVSGLVGDWRLPDKVQNARRAVCDEIDRLRSGQPLEVVEFTSPELRKRIAAYMRELDMWCAEDEHSALTALAWMDSVFVVSRASGTPEVELLIQLPTHPARLRAISGLTALLANKASGDHGWLPPLSRLYGMAGPNNWVLRSTG